MSDTIEGGTTPKLPRMWVGYVLVVLVFVAAVIDAEINSGEGKTGPDEYIYTLLVVFGASLYWLYCVYRFHDVLAEIPGYDHSISPGRAVGMHWVPFYNLYWVFKWSSEIATFVNWRTQATAMNGKIVGTLVLCAFLVGRVVDSSLGLLLLFSAGVYINRHLRRAFAAPPVPASAMAKPGPCGPLGL